MADTATRLLAIEHEISAHRAAYLHAYWAGKLGDCDHHDSEINRLLTEWRTVRDQATKEPA